MRKKKKKFWRPIITGFTVLYLMSMGLATYLMEIKFADEFKENAAQHLSSIQRQVESDLEDTGDKTDGAYYSYIASQIMSAETSGQFQRFSLAFYQTDGTLLAKAEDRIWISGSLSDTYTLEHLTDEDKEILAGYAQRSRGNGSLSGDPPKYRISTCPSKDGKSLRQILVQELSWGPTDQQGSEEYTDPVTDCVQLYENVQGKEYVETASKIEWEWNAPGADKTSAQTREAQILFPYLVSGGYDQWLKWNKSDYLQGSKKQIDISQDKIEQTLAAFSDDTYTIRKKDVLYTSIWSDVDGDFKPVCYAALLFESHPWLAAMDHLKYVYLASLILMLTCIVKVLYVTNKTYEQRAATEDMRRDFTNAIAHELKTPLSIIRGFAENLQEHHMEDKRDYYLAQIISQTEEIDQLVTEMIQVSKMDSEHLPLQKTPVSIYSLIRTQLERLEPIRQEKDIQIEYACHGDFIIDGDIDHLSKAIWNLLSNALIYNIQDGSIQIRTDAKSCTITNTGAPLTEEQLTHVFDMFYSGDKSRSAKDKHMGLGLFLTKKILQLHNLKITLKNTREGVQVSITK